MPHTLRLPSEDDDAFLVRAERTGRIAGILIDACLQNRCMQRFIADPDLPLITEESARRNPTVRIEYEQAIAIGGVGETLDATKSKHWGDGPWVMPLLVEDEFFPDRISYLYRENSLYNRRFEQRKRLKELLGQRWRSLVGQAKWQAKALFLESLTQDQSAAITRILSVSPGSFWRACQGRAFLDLPGRLVQHTFEFDESSGETPWRESATESQALPSGSH